MAELAVGLTKSVVEVVLTKAQAALEEEGKLRKSAQRQLVFITDEFQMMQSFLVVANEERVGNVVVMTWVRQIRELAYDMEDSIEFVVHLKKSGWWRRLLHSLIPPCVPTAALPLDEAVEEIEQLKQRVEDVSRRNARYSLISDTGSKPVPQQAAAAGAAVSADAAGIINLQLLQDMDAGAGKRQLGDLTQFIITNQDQDGHGQQLEVISVWGTGGDLGTTSLIRKAYTDPEICTTFPCRAWVNLLVRPFDPCEFVRCLVAQFHANSWRTDDETTAAATNGIQKKKKKKDDGADVPVGLHFLIQQMKKKDDGAEPEGGHLFHKFERQVTEKRYLVVLEGVSDMQEWDAIRSFLPDMKNGSRIIVSTQQFEIARLCIGQSAQVLQLEQFSADHSVCAFFREGSQSDGGKSEDTDRASSSNTGHASSSSQGFGIGVASSEDRRILTEKRNAAKSWNENHPHFCRDSEMKELRKIVAKTQYDNFKVSMSVWGIAGVGKSHLIKKLFHFYVLGGSSNNSGEGQFDKFSWVNVSQPFRLRDFCWSLLLGFQSESRQDKDIAYRRMIGSKNPIQECLKLLKQRRCLVVINDLQSKEHWDSIRQNLVSGCRSLIIVITTEASVAAHCASNEDLVFNVKGLQAEAAFGLFKSKVGIPSQQCETKSMLEQLVLKCGGLPKVIDAIATLLAAKGLEQMDTARTINQRFIHQLETNLEFSSLRGLFVWMYNYFRTCPDHLKPCIFYMSIFPQAYNIRRRRLVRRWIAEGYSRDSDDKSAEDNGEEYFSKLIDLSIVQEPPEFLTKKLCQVNGFVREYIVSRRMEENLIFELGDTCALTTQRTGRHLVIRESWDRDKVVFGSMDFSRLRSLTVFGKWKSFFISESMKLLRALDLENASVDSVTDDDVEQVVKLLRRLKFLSLRGCSKVCRLPCSLSELRQLQSLDVRHTSIVTLPEGITKLQKLQYIRAGTTIPANDEESGSCPSWSWLSCSNRRRQLHGVMVPRGIGKLTAQHTLGVVNIGASGGKAILKELKELTQLRKLGVSGINKKNCKEFLGAISGHKHLESLFVHLDKGSGGCLGDISKPMPVNLLSLKLYGTLDTLPTWIGKLSKLTKLDLVVTMLNQSGIELLGKLPDLTILRFHLMPVNEGNNNLSFRVEMNGCELDSYTKVRVLEIACSYSLTVKFGSKAMMNLEVLKRYCLTESVTFSGQENLKNLKVETWDKRVDWTAPAAQVHSREDQAELHSLSS